MNINNPDLFPGMFPSLYPLGIGGFDEKHHQSLISFRAQAEYYLDHCDRSFRYHKFFIFVALNMHQRRIAHLHTAFMVKRHHFNETAKKLVYLTSAKIS
jgi:hypothetical protein